jgi:hypothetical protein
MVHTNIKIPLREKTKEKLSIPMFLKLGIEMSRNIHNGTLLPNGGL